MTTNWTPPALVYLALSVVGLVGTWSFNMIAIVQMRDYLGDWVGSGPSVSSLTVDLLVAAVAGGVFILLESRRLGIPRAWLYVLAAIIIAFAFSFPLFLAVRQRRLEALKRADSAPSNP